MFTKATHPLGATQLFDALFLDYVAQKKELQDFHSGAYSKEGFTAYLNTVDFSSVDRTTLVNELVDQAKRVGNTSELSSNNIQKLVNTNCYTVTTGHQLCLFTGPLYFIYKILSTIKLSEQLKQWFPNSDFVPVYWMATEDHDSEEINHAYVYGKKLSWATEQKGSVGEFSTEGIESVIEELKQILGESKFSSELIDLFKLSYIEHKTLADATRYLVNALFGTCGLVIIDGNSNSLKQLAVKEFKREITDTVGYTFVTDTTKKLSALGYSSQVNPRTINLFYKTEGVRERIEKQGDTYTVLNTDKQFTLQELYELIEKHPEQISPNVVLRPCYQQKILPNIAYVGGPGEIAYWLEYKALFDDLKLNFPVLVPRQFVMVIEKNIQQRLEKLELKTSDVFKGYDELVKDYVKSRHQDINLDQSKSSLTTFYNELVNYVSTIDKTLGASAEAEKQKSLNGLQAVEQKIVKSLKQKSDTEINQLKTVKAKLFPDGIPQERYDNFSAYYAKWGQEFIKNLYNQLDFDSEPKYLILSEK